MIVSTTERPTLAIQPAQLAVILGLETVLQQAGMVLCCPRCVREHNDLRLKTDNAPEDAIWKVNCRCRTRQIAKADAHAPLEPSGHLIVLADELLAPLSLAVRCPSVQLTCRHMNLTVRPEVDGWRVSCGCSTYRFQRHPERSH